MSALVPMLFSRQEAAREAATEAVAALCSYHQEGKLAYLEGLVQEVLQRVPDSDLPQGVSAEEVAAHREYPAPSWHGRPPPPGKPTSRV